MTKLNFDFLGQKQVIEFLEKSIEKNSLSHAYIFAGAPNIGKFTLAKLFAKSLECTSKTNIPCNSCDSCYKTENASHPDIQIIEKEEDKKGITIEQIRDLEHNLSLNPYCSKYKIVIIKDAENLNLEASNSLLKTLEEPSAKSILILTVSNQAKLLPTIVSRCQLIKLKPVLFENIYNFLKKKGVPDERAIEISRIVFGRPGLAVKMSEDDDLFLNRKKLTGELLDLLQKSDFEKMNFVKNIKKEDLDRGKDIVDILMLLFRDMFLLKMNVSSTINYFFKKRLEDLSAKISQEKITKAINVISDVKNQLKYNVNLKLTLETLLINLPKFD